MFFKLAHLSWEVVKLGSDTPLEEVDELGSDTALEVEGLGSDSVLEKVEGLGNPFEPKTKKSMIIPRW